MLIANTAPNSPRDDQALLAENVLARMLLYASMSYIANANRSWSTNALLFLSWIHGYLAMTLCEV